MSDFATTSTSSDPPALESTAERAAFWPNGWWKWMDVKIGIIPVPLYLGLLAIIAYFAWLGKVSNDVCMMSAVIAVGAFGCAELGERLPFVRRMGGAAILCPVLPSIAVYCPWAPAVLIKPVVDFTKYTVFLYLFIACLIVGSILGMDRTVLIKCFAKIFVPITLGTVVAGIVGVTVAWLCGLEPRHALFFIVVPVMTG